MSITLIRIAALALAILPSAAHAQAVCGSLPGCQSSWYNFAADVLTHFAEALPDMTLYIGGLFVVLSGFYMLLNLGDETRIEKAKKMLMWSLAGIFVGMFAQEFVEMYLATETYVDPGTTPYVLANVFVALKRILRNFFNVALLIAIVFNAARMVLSRGNEEEWSKAKKGFFWAVIGAILVNVADRVVDAMIGLV